LLTKYIIFFIHILTKWINGFKFIITKTHDTLFTLVTLNLR
jgi:hypothetical protein